MTSSPLSGGDFAGDREPVTIAMPLCTPDHPPRTCWPTSNLIRGVCPDCGWHESDGKASARVLRARRLIQGAEPEDPAP